MTSLLSYNIIFVEKQGYLNEFIQKFVYNVCKRFLLMQEVTIRVINEIICQVVGLTDFDRDLLYKEYGVFIPSARYQPKYKIGLWDGKIHYFEKMEKRL